LTRGAVATDIERKPIVEQQISISSECPLMRDDLGRATWSSLHTMAADHKIRTASFD
jgi:hypothetical protein